MGSIIIDYDHDTEVYCSKLKEKFANDYVGVSHMVLCQGIWKYVRTDNGEAEVYPVYLDSDYFRCKATVTKDGYCSLDFLSTKVVTISKPYRGITSRERVTIKYLKDDSV